eukprot:CAMPEP_0202871384 /NCGR_PEP_ID=MMETSP1391-20130828/18506_1 /ASSEMBLY_ACC=CAM_ASM_000867 /TAXON_ID=1034604 /ORGANISM="Chlamydomonas leiostraca, Strain SAG 11-49" /LENGTH=38 /DNA_ID= /DNA_START= /DNA_END= /DNA_ORIENTATION=
MRVFVSVQLAFRVLVLLATAAAAACTQLGYSAPGSWKV